jgi:hypothetical protein
MGIFVALRSVLGDSKVAKAFRGFGAPRPRPAVHIDGTGIGLALDPSQPDTITPAISWSEVRRVVAFKRDLLAVDLVCLWFEGPDSHACEVNEEMAGWGELLDSLPEYLPGCIPKVDILGGVVKRAFATSELVIYRRPSA